MSPVPQVPRRRHRLQLHQERMWELREKLRQAQKRLRKVQREKRSLEQKNQLLQESREQLKESTETLHQELRERERRESTLSSRVRSLESELERRLREEEQRQNETRAREEELSNISENTEAHRRRVEDHLHLQKDRMAALQEVQRLQKSLRDQQEEQIHHLEMERRRLHNDTQEPKDNIPVFCRVRSVLPEESERQRGLHHLHFSPQNSTTLIVSQPDEVSSDILGGASGLLPAVIPAPALEYRAKTQGMLRACSSPALGCATSTQLLLGSSLQPSTGGSSSARGPLLLESSRSSCNNSPSPIPAFRDISLELPLFCDVPERGYRDLSQFEETGMFVKEDEL
ncbi:kinesin-like protein KIFC1 isoform X2 [Pipra filicauda]|uniref:Kinesin-like protein KIFC1 isoform X2 n=1 Tax=Pipra filicauda TaxID=649802 RepID=A0A6J2FSY5_9PASS|nr:kinesin-like protein KIFC1 isoform X2 [Pipra filicauda]